MPSDHESYWSEYDGLQWAKHRLLARYLQAWFPILGSFSGKVLYIDCHAGRGRHDTGHEGSPLLAVKTLLNHGSRDRILQRCEVHFTFFETDSENYRALLSEIEAIGSTPSGILIRPYPADHESSLSLHLAELESRKLRLAPSFAFLDPFGISLSMNLINRILSFEHCEVLVNFMVRYVDMAVRRKNVPHQVLDKTFGTSRWREAEAIPDDEQRKEFLINLFAEQLHAKYVSFAKMNAANGILKYVLIHASNHLKGREVFKESLWHVFPDGSFSASERTNPRQLVLVISEPDLEPLRRLLWGRFAGQTLNTKDIENWAVAYTPYLRTHVRKVLRHERKEGRVLFSDYSGRFNFEDNPRAYFPPDKGP